MANQIFGCWNSISDTTVRKREEMGSWNSLSLEIIYQVLGWIAFFTWSISFYPQIFLNYRRKSVVGLNFDYVVLNFTKHSTYLICNASLFFSSAIQKQYHEKYGFEEMIPVAVNDVAFSTHAVAMTLVTFYQVFMYDRGGQKISKASLAITSAAWMSAAVCLSIAWPCKSWLWLIRVFNSIQLVTTVLKYIPQAVMNFGRKSTEGWSIGNTLLDLTGGVANYGQMTMQSIDQGSWMNFYGNIGKTLLSMVSIIFDFIFMFQHYVLYPSQNETISEHSAPLIKPSDPPQSENV